MVYNKKFLKKLLRALEATALPSRPCPEDGICRNVYRRMGGYQSFEQQLASKLLKAIFQLWPKYSGQRLFPIPGNFVSPFWDKELRQGQLRYELLAFITEEVEHMIAFIEEFEKESEDD